MNSDIHRSPPPQKVLIEPEPRHRCIWCCALRYSCISGALAFVVTGIPSMAMHGRKWLMTNKPLTIISHVGYIAFPIMCMSFTHHALLSAALWSPRRTPILEVQMQSAVTNAIVWLALVGIGTFASRRVLGVYHRDWRLALFEHRRQKRGVPLRLFPNVVGSLWVDFDVVQALWMVNVYHTFWLGSALCLETIGTKYAFLSKDTKYSYYCSPRWREWSDAQLESSSWTHKISRWGGLFNK